MKEHKMTAENKTQYSIPVVINNRDRLTSTRQLVTDLLSAGYTDIHILDNGSTYALLLEWYKIIDQQITIHYLDNLGQAALWKSGIIKQFSKYRYLVYTDSDIQLNRNTPPHFIETLCTCLEEYNVDKAGLAIEYNNLPDIPVNKKNYAIEHRYWKKRLKNNKGLEVYDAPIDTTFAVIRPGMPYSWTLRAVRVAGEFTCRHLPWYVTPDTQTEEDIYYMQHADPRYCSLKVLTQQQ